MFIGFINVSNSVTYHPFSHRHLQDELGGDDDGDVSPDADDYFEALRSLLMD